MKSTIVALATPSGRGAIAVLRISGNEVHAVIKAVLRLKLRPRYAKLCPFFEQDGTYIDKGIAIFFPAPHSFTGEDVLELQIHGGPCVVELLIKRLLSLPDTRLARPGEFSERAFLNGKMDLTQAEAIADLIDAQSEASARAAVKSLEGGLSVPIQVVQQQLTALRSRIEAEIDFSDQISSSGLKNDVVHDLKKMSTRIMELLSVASAGLSLRNTGRVVLAGAPNVGKSSLMNALAHSEVAIVSDLPGTTRDLVRAELSLGDTTVELIDSAGLRETVDPIELQGVKRAQLAIQSADQLLWVVDAQQLPLDAEPGEVVALLPNFSELPKKIVVIRNKIDQQGEQPSLVWVGGYPILSLSAKSGAGLDRLKEIIGQRERSGRSPENVFLARTRHLVGLKKTLQALEGGMLAVLQNQPLECLAEELRTAQAAMAALVGQVTTEELLKEIFSRFCLGK